MSKESLPITIRDNVHFKNLVIKFRKTPIKILGTKVLNFRFMPTQWSERKIVIQDLVLCGDVDIESRGTFWSLSSSVFVFLKSMRMDLK